jgi:hypothetical protein
MKTVAMRKPHQEDVRKKIQASLLINRLEDCVSGKVELSSTQVTAALGLLKKTLPDLSSVEMDISGSLNHELHLNELK